MIIKDSLSLTATGLTRSADGYLHGMVRVSRAGNVQEYLGREIGMTGDDADKTFGIYRDPDVVFDEASMSSLVGRPVTRNHPPEGVNARTWKDLSVGQIGGRIVRDGEHVVAPFAIMDAVAADEMEAGAVGSSAGYTTGIVADAGVSPSGEAYQYRQSGPIRFNHVAYLPDNNPRAGNTRFGDARNWGFAPSTTTSETKEDIMSDALKTVVLGDKAAQVAVADASIIEQFKADSAKALTDMQTAHQTALDAKAEEIGTLKADLKKAQDAAITPEKMTTMVADRVALETVVKTIDAKIETANVSDADLRKAAVVSVHGAEMVADADEAEVRGMFKAIAKDAANADPVAAAIKDGKSNPKIVGLDAAYADRNASLSTAWMDQTKKEA